MKIFTMLLVALVVSGCSSYKAVTFVAPFDPWPYQVNKVLLEEVEEPSRYFKGRLRDRIWRDR